MISKSLIFFILSLSYITCEYSGIKAAIDSTFFKLLKKFDLNSLLSNKTLISHAEIIGEYLYHYNIDIENFSLPYVYSPEDVKVETGSLGEKSFVKVIAYQIEAKFLVDYLFLKYGVVTDRFYGANGHIIFSSISGNFYFTNDGKLEIEDFEVGIEKLELDMRKTLSNFLLKVFRDLIRDKVAIKFKAMGETISEILNNKLINKPFIYELGLGIGLNLTNIEKPKLNLVNK